MDTLGLHLNRLLEDEFQTELRVRVVKNEHPAKIEFHNTLPTTGGKSLLSKIHLPIQNIPPAVSRFRFRLLSCIHLCHTTFSFLSALNPLKMNKISMKNPLTMIIIQAF